jgi:hypothetical protein
VTNLDNLIANGIILQNNLPAAADVTTINSLNPNDVQGLINVWNAVGQPFLIRDCNPGGTVAPASGVRTIGIVF